MFRTSRFKLHKIPETFMDNELSRLAILNIISHIERCRKSQQNIDCIYDKLCDVIIAEMNATIPKYDTSKRTSKRLKTKKTYWNQTLAELWKVMRQNERDFLRCSSNRNVKTALRRNYITARNMFDKVLRQTERAYRQTVAFDIEDMSSNNPNDFWEKIKNLGPRTDRSIPVEIISDGITSNDENKVFEKWKLDFENLYTCSNNNEFDDTHYNQAKTHKLLIENNMNDPLYVPNEILNRNINFDELTHIVMHAKSRSASGYDEIPYCVLKNPPVIAVLQQLFQLVFDSSIIPSLWRKAIICPILKDCTTDKRIQMNYRGISLLSCVSKLYSSFMNKRITKYLEQNNILADEQNGLRSNRSCEDHVFTLNSILRNNDSDLTAFIDLRKCFDFIDRDMMLYKL